MCGIFGIITKDKRKFDYSAFCTLGIDNDSRGGDSCGICIDKKYEYGTGKLKFFQDFFTQSDLLKKVVESKIALGHCRKASVGSISEKTAQPVIIEDKSNRVRFVMLHNGTIYNYEDLAKKYIPDIDIKGMTDSQVMARIFYYKGYDALEEYEGGSVFAIVDYRQPEPLLLLFKGASKKYSSDAAEVEERPLYTTVSDDGELIFSSTYDFLEAIRRNQKVYTIKANCLITFDGDDLKILKTYSRKNVCQTKKYIAKAYNYPSYNTNKNYYNQWDDYYSGGCYGGNLGLSSYNTGQYLSCDKLTNTYNIEGKLANGKLKLNKYGRIITEDSKESVKTEEIWFIHGIAMSGKDTYERIQNLEKRFKLKESKFLELYQNLIRYLSLDKVYRRGKEMVKATKPNKFELFTGTYQSIGEVMLTRYINGKSKEITKGGNYEDSFKIKN